MGRKNKRKRHPVKELAIETILEQHKKFQDEALEAVAVHEELQKKQGFKKQTPPMEFYSWRDNVDWHKSEVDWVIIATMVLFIMWLVFIAVRLILLRG